MRNSWGLGVLTILVWATGYPAGSLAVAAAAPLLFTTVRFAAAAGAMALIAWQTRARWPRGRLLAHTAVVGVLTQAVHFTGVYSGMHAGVPAAVSALVIGLNPVVTALLAALTLGERLTWMRLAGLGLGVLAVLSALGDRLSRDGITDPGTLLTLLGLFGFAVGGIYQQRFCRAVDVRSGAAVQLAVATPVVGVAALFESGTVRDWSHAGVLLCWIVLINSALGASLYLSLVRRTGAARTTTLFSVVPAVTAVVAWPLLGQAPTAGVWLGIVLGAAACVAGTRTPRRKVNNIRPEVEEPAIST